jgi:hypothetical protein
MTVITATAPNLLSGIDQLRSALAGDLPLTGIGRLLGLRLDERSAGHVVFSLGTQCMVFAPLGGGR